MKQTKQKRLAALLLAVAAVLALCASCGPSQENQPGAGATEPAAPVQTPAGEPAEPTAAPAETPAETEPESPEGEPAGITVTDMMGREIVLEAPADRVVALTASDCEILYAIGAGDALVGRGEYCDYPPEVLELPAVDSGAETNIEQILALEPQVLLMSSMAQSKEQVEQLENAGVHAVVSNAQDIQGTYEAIRIIGALMGKEEEAAAVVEGMQTSFEELKTKAEAARSAAGGAEKSIYFEVSPLQWGLWAAGSNTFMDEVAELLGLTNCFADVEGWSAVSEEQVLQRSPDYILTITMDYGEGPTPVEEILGRPGWENVGAVQNGAVLNLTGNELSRPGPRLVDGAQALFDFVYGTED